LLRGSNMFIARSHSTHPAPLGVACK
jgi:hypothetical protein